MHEPRCHPRAALELVVAQLAPPVPVPVLVPMLTGQVPVPVPVPDQQP